MSWFCNECYEELHIDITARRLALPDGWAVETRYVDDSVVRRIFHDPTENCEECGEAVWTPQSELVGWHCADCGSNGPFKTVRRGNPIEGDDVDCVCVKCGSDNTGEESDVIALQHERIEELEGMQPFEQRFRAEFGDWWIEQAKSEVSPSLVDLLQRMARLYKESAG